MASQSKSLVVLKQARNASEMRRYEAARYFDGVVNQPRHEKFIVRADEHDRRRYRAAVLAGAINAATGAVA